MIFKSSIIKWGQAYFREVHLKKYSCSKNRKFTLLIYWCFLASNTLIMSSLFLTLAKDVIIHCYTLRLYLAGKHPISRIWQNVRILPIYLAQFDRRHITVDTHIGFSLMVTVHVSIRLYLTQIEYMGLFYFIMLHRSIYRAYKVNLT